MRETNKYQVVSFILLKSINRQYSRILKQLTEFILVSQDNAPQKESLLLIKSTIEKESSQIRLILEQIQEDIRGLNEEIRDRELEQELGSAEINPEYFKRQFMDYLTNIRQSKMQQNKFQSIQYILHLNQIIDCLQIENLNQ